MVLPHHITMKTDSKEWLVIVLIQYDNIKRKVYLTET